MTHHHYRRFSLIFILAVTIVVNFYDLCIGMSDKDRYFKCFHSRMMGQQNCSPCVDLFVFNRTVNYRRCEHINGLCYPFRTVFKTARECEDTCRPYIERSTLQKTTTKEPDLNNWNSSSSSEEEYDL